VAEAYASGLHQLRGQAEAARWATWYLTNARKDRFPAPIKLTALATLQASSGRASP
jgi:alkyl sulfatase BDS1-like metallo-beta-lactamase superfamily hydrolase